MREAKLQVQMMLQAAEETTIAMKAALAALSQLHARNTALLLEVQNVQRAFEYLRQNIPDYDHVFEAAYDIAGPPPEEFPEEVPAVVDAAPKPASLPPAQATPEAATKPAPLPPPQPVPSTNRTK